MRRLLLLSIVCLLVAVGVGAEEEAETPSYPGGVAKLLFEGSQISTVPYSDAPRGPLFSLEALTGVLGVEMVIGPLGDSHRLLLKEREVVVGPGRAVAVVIPKEKDAQNQLMTFNQVPIRTAAGLEVSLDFIAKTLSDELSADFEWDESAVELRVTRHKSRTLAVGVDVFHLSASTVEVRFSARPRYRVERLPEGLMIRLSGDRIQLPVDTSRASSPLLSRIDVNADRLFIAPVEGAAIAEPRMLDQGEDGVRLIIEVFRQARVRGNVDEPGFELPPGIRTIVLDPGHGGPESGAVGQNGTEEKVLALAIARSLKRLIERRLRVRVVLTRSADVDLPLEMRTAIANQNKADLFISLHFNSYAGVTAHGAETYFLSREASDQVAADLAAKENSQSGGDNPETDLQLILWDLAQSHHLAESQFFAKLVQEELNQTLGLRNRGVKQAPFQVLMGATMPAVLVELGFISNAEEEAKLQSPIYQAELVDALFRAIQRFKTQVESRAEAPSEDRPERGPGVGGGA